MRSQPVAAAAPSAVAGGADKAPAAPDGAQGHEKLGSRLREARQAAHLGVRELARRLELSASLISQIELGRVLPSVSTLYALTSALGVSMDSLFAASDSSPEGRVWSNGRQAQRERGHRARAGLHPAARYAPVDRA